MKNLVLILFVLLTQHLSGQSLYGTATYTLSYTGPFSNEVAEARQKYRVPIGSEYSQLPSIISCTSADGSTIFELRTDGFSWNIPLYKWDISSPYEVLSSYDRPCDTWYFKLQYGRAEIPIYGLENAFTSLPEFTLWVFYRRGEVFFKAMDVAGNMIVYGTHDLQFVFPKKFE
jgi:hypothetical protein